MQCKLPCCTLADAPCPVRSAPGCWTFSAGLSICAHRDKASPVSSSTQSIIKGHCSEAGPRSSQEVKSIGQDLGQCLSGVRLSADTAAVWLSWTLQWGGRLLLPPLLQQFWVAKKLTLDRAIFSKGGVHSDTWHVMLCTHFLGLGIVLPPSLWQSAIKAKTQQANTKNKRIKISKITPIQY